MFQLWINNGWKSKEGLIVEEYNQWNEVKIELEQLHAEKAGQFSMFMAIIQNNEQAPGVARHMINCFENGYL